MPRDLAAFRSHSWGGVKDDWYCVVCRLSHDDPAADEPCDGVADLDDWYPRPAGDDPRPLAITWPSDTIGFADEWPLCPECVAPIPPGRRLDHNPTRCADRRREAMAALLEEARHP